MVQLDLVLDLHLKRNVKHYMHGGSSLVAREPLIYWSDCELEFGCELEYELKRCRWVLFSVHYICNFYCGASNVVYYRAMSLRGIPLVEKESGQRIRTITSSYYRGAHGSIVSGVLNLAMGSCVVTIAHTGNRKAGDLIDIVGY